MTTSTDRQETHMHLPRPDHADTIAAGRDYPIRDARQPFHRQAAAQLFEQQRQWWLDAAAGWADLAEAALGAGDDMGRVEALGDARQCMRNAEQLGRHSVGVAR